VLFHRFGYSNQKTGIDLIIFKFNERPTRNQQEKTRGVKQYSSRMKARRQNRLAGLTSEVSEPQRSEIKLEKKEYSLQKSEHIHVAGALVETYDMEIQCALETRSLDSRPAKDREE
jgi:hypothetical protein